MTHRAKAPAQSPAGALFIDCAGTNRCLWPLSGAGAFMEVCGERRAAGCAYCENHRRAGGGPAVASPPRPRVNGLSL